MGLFNKKRRDGTIELAELGKDFLYQRDYASNTYEIMGQLMVDGDLVSYMYRFSIYIMPSGDPICVTYFYFSGTGQIEPIDDVQVYDKDNVILGVNKLLIRTPSSELTGNEDNLHLYVEMDELALNVNFKPKGKAFSFNQAPDRDFEEHDMHHFELPFCTANGNISTFAEFDEIENGSAYFAHTWQRKVKAGKKDRVVEVPLNMVMKAKLSNGESLLIYTTKENDKEKTYAASINQQGETRFFSTNGLLPQMEYFLAESEELRIQKIEEEKERVEREEETTNTQILRARDDTRKNKVLMDLAEKRRQEALARLREEENQDTYDKKVQQKQDAIEKDKVREKEKKESSAGKFLTGILKNTGILKSTDAPDYIPKIEGGESAILDMDLSIHEVKANFNINFEPRRHTAIFPDAGEFQHFEGMCDIDGSMLHRDVTGYCYLNITD